MKVEKYLRIRKELKSAKDLDRVVRKYKIKRGTAFSILVQKRIRYVSRNYRRFESRMEEILKFWEEYGTFPRWLRVPPIMKLRILFKAMGFSKSKISNILKNPESCKEFEDLIFDALYKDFVYSPIATENLAARGKIGERIVERHLSEIGVEFLKEEEIKGNATPDFLILDDFKIRGESVRWIECKSMFGDFQAFNDSSQQFKKYFESFGKGAIVYWLGYIDGMDCELLILDDIGRNCEEKRFLKDMVVKIYDDGEFSWKGGYELRSSKFVRELIRFFRSGATSIAAEEKDPLRKALKFFGYVVE